MDETSTTFTDTSTTLTTFISTNTDHRQTFTNTLSTITMRFSTTFLIPIAGLASTTTATSMTLGTCAISHTAIGNQFTMQWSNVPLRSQSSLCGHFADAVGALAGQIVVKGITCSTDDAGNMATVVTLDKTSCVNQANEIGQAMSQALGSGGTLSYDTGKCNFASSKC